jgi:hypothetical protein
MSELEDSLFKILGLVNDWLKYLEAKHAGLIVVAGAGIATCATVLFEANQPLTGPSRTILLAVVGLLLVTEFFSLLSFIPRINSLHWVGLKWGWGNPKASDNLITSEI